MHVMQMNDVIRRKRRELGLTQEQVAEYLGVSAPAVNKWENGATYPDISLVPALARLLKSDPNTLMCFRESLTREEMAKEMNEVARISQEEGVEAAVTRVRDLAEEYPSCGELLYQLATMLRGLVILRTAGDEQRQECQEYAVRLYERAGEYLQRLPEYSSLDKRQLQISMYMKQEKNEEAARLIEQKLNGSIIEVYLLLDNLATVAAREGDRERAREIAGYGRKVMEAWQWDYSGLTLEFTVAVEERDGDRCVELLREMLDSLSRPRDMEKSFLFAHIATKELDPDLGGQIKDALMTAIEKNEQYAFLREREDFQELFRSLRKR